MAVRVGKAEALAALEHHRRELELAPGDCVMCALSLRGSRQEPIVETEHAVVTLDRFGSRNGHLLVIPRRHLESPTDLGWERFVHVQRLCFEAVATLEHLLRPTRVFVAALGAPDPVPMSFPHHHVHVLPLFERGEETRPARVFSWSDGVVLYEDAEAAALTRTLREHWATDATHPSAPRGLDDSSRSNEPVFS